MSTATGTIERSEGREGLASMIRRVKIRNYKSIKNCDVELGPFTILVGRNGAGKSNSLDALRFLSESLWDGLDRTARRDPPWAGVAEDGAAIPDMTIALEMILPSGDEANYVAGLAGSAPSTMTVREELLQIRSHGRIKEFFECHDERPVRGSVATPPAPRGGLYLERAADLREFREVYESLVSMRFHDIAPQAIRASQFSISIPQLDGAGSNLASAFEQLESRPQVRDRLLAYLRLIVPEVSDVRTETFGPVSPLVFEVIGGLAGSKKFFVGGMSDGTLRALGILVAINQLAPDGKPIRLVGIEEPETALHPAAAGALMDAFRDAAGHTQILVTTHGADLLDRFDPEEDHILAVEYRDGRTEIGPVNPASRDAIREHLYSAGELLRMDQLHPDRLDVERRASIPSAGPNGPA
jgi:predicted ATPase